MNQEDCFTPLRHKAVELPDYIQWLLDQDIEWAEHFGFQAVPLPADFIQIEPALQELDKIWQIKRLGLLRVEPMSVYDWHVDEYRLSCVNMLYSINDSSHALFGAQRDALNKDVVELRYQSDTFYLFNNQMPHTVINLGGPRYLFSLYFEEEKDYCSLRDLYNG